MPKLFLIFHPFVRNCLLALAHDLPDISDDSPVNFTGPNIRAPDATANSVGSALRAYAAFQPGTSRSSIHPSTSSMLHLQASRPCSPQLFYFGTEFS